MSRYWKAIITKQEAGITLEQFLKRKLELTHRQISRLKFQDHGLMVNEEHVRATYILHVNDRVCIELERDYNDMICGHYIALDILYESDDLLIVSKPSGMVVHPVKGYYQDTLLAHVGAYLKANNETAHLHCVGRLDKDTSGIVVFAKNRICAQKLALQRSRKQFTKTYLALAQGIFEKKRDTITTPIKLNPQHPTRMICASDGKHAITHYEVIKQYPNHALLNVQIDTGRMHQIRVHMQSIHHPILGDVLYGNKESAQRLCLHAWKIQLLHPFTNEPLCFFDQENETLWDNEKSA